MVNTVPSVSRAHNALNNRSNNSVAYVIDLMIRFVEDAAVLAINLRDRGVEVSYKDGHFGQALTEADLAISRMLHDRFSPRLIEEETANDLDRTAAAHMLSEDAWTFIADPIDGTQPYTGNLNAWGTMIAACRKGWPTASACILPTWAKARNFSADPVPASEQRGLLLAAWSGTAYWAPTQGGRRLQNLRPLQPIVARTGHVGWLAVLARSFALDYQSGLFPWCESAAIADAALLATGKLDASVTAAKIWDLAPVLPILQSLGFGLYRWPDLEGQPHNLIELYDENFSNHDSPWLICRDKEMAMAFSAAIRRAR